MTIIIICHKCNSDEITRPNRRYPKTFRCRACGVVFEKPKMVREPVSEEDMRELERQANALRQQLHLEGMEYLRIGKRPT